MSAPKPKSSPQLENKETADYEIEDVKPQISTVPYELTKKREDVRTIVTVSIIAATVVYPFFMTCMVALGWLSSTEAKELSGQFFPILTLCAGAVVGFYLPKK